MIHFNRLTTQLQEILTEAYNYAVLNNHPYIESTHFLLKLLEQNNQASQLLQLSGVNIINLNLALKNILKLMPQVSCVNKNLQLGRNLVNLLNLANKEAQRYKDCFISSEMILLALVSDTTEVGFKARECGLIRKSLEAQINIMRGGVNIMSQKDEFQREVLQKYTCDLTERARRGEIDPVIGRDDEIRRTIQILQRRSKNNPVLIGKPGVGKTAIVEGLAQRIINGEVPDSIKLKRVLSLDMSALLAGAKYRGEFEERFKGVLEEISKDKNKIIIFIDELHTVVGAGKADGAIDASNMIKPALARGELHCVGATTLDEYRQYIEKDLALERRFQKIVVDEPSVEATIAILRGLQEKYEVHHGVDITDPAIVAAAELSHRYITERFLPDKAIDLIDEAAAKIKIEIDSKPEVMDKLERRLIQLKIEREAVNREKDHASKKRLLLIEDEISQLEKKYLDLEEIWKKEKSIVQGSQSLKEEIESVRLKINDATRASDWQKVSELKYGKLVELEKRLDTTNKRDVAIGISDFNVLNLIRTKVGAEEIIEIVAHITGIPISKIVQSEREKLLHLEEILHQRVVGQNEAIVAVANAIRRSRAGLSDPQKPYGSFMFFGPTGVGKTELCKALAMYLFDAENMMIRIDMSEFIEKHSVARLIGAPPGYIGYEEGGYLTEAVRRKPYSVILLDEIEKAHSDVCNLLLQVLDDGRMTDGQGRTVDFKNTVIVMTSNLGSQIIQTQDDSLTIKRTIIDEAKLHFRPEFINRIDEIVVFHALTRTHIGLIAKLQLNSLETRLAKMNINLRISSDGLNKIIDTGFDPVYGARPLKRAIQNEIENPLSKFILQGKIIFNDVVNIDVKNNILTFAIHHKNNHC